MGYLTSCFSVGMLVGPLLGGYMSCRAAMWTCIASTAITLVYVAIFVPECAPEPLARRAARKAAAEAAKRARAAGAQAAAGAAAGSLAMGQAEDEQVESAEAGRPRDAAGRSLSRAWAEQEAQQEQAAEEEAVAETVSLLSAQQHMMGGAVAVAPGAVAAPPVGECVYGCPADGAGHHSHRGGDGGFSTSSKHDVVHEHHGYDDSAAPPTLSASAKAGAGDASTSSHVSGSSSKGASSRSPLSGMAAGWSVIRGSSFYRRIALIWVVVSMTWEGAGELLMQYLQLRLGFNTQDQVGALASAAVAACSACGA